MRFRKNCFGILALLTVIVAVAWIASGLAATEEEPTTSEAEEAGRTIGQGSGVTTILCITIPLALFFALLSWRNSVGLGTERRHQEELEALRKQ